MVYVHYERKRCTEAGEPCSLNLLSLSAAVKMCSCVISAALTCSAEHKSVWSRLAEQNRLCKNRQPDIIGMITKSMMNKLDL